MLTFEKTSQTLITNIFKNFVMDEQQANSSSSSSGKEEMVSSTKNGDGETTNYVSQRKRPLEMQEKEAKQRKLSHSTQDSSPSETGSTSSTRTEIVSHLKKSLLLQPDILECPLCQSLLYQPITTSCGHTFCKSCILRVMDHANKCPMCRCVIYITPESAINYVLEKMILVNFPDEHLAREKEIMQELNAQQFNLPLFLLGETILMPESSLPLHVFEPRYRLMIRRCLEGGRRFGIVPQINGKLCDIGTVAIIENHWLLPDGRSLIATIGDMRFKVVDVWDQDGYQVAKVDYILDKPLNDSKAGDLIDSKFEQAKTLFFQKFSSPTVNQIQDKLGKIPSTACSFTWWLAYVLPVPVEKKYEILQTLSVEERLSKLISYLQELDFSEVEETDS